MTRFNIIDMILPEHITDNHIEICMHIPARVVPFTSIRKLTCDILRDFFTVSDKTLHRIEAVIDEMVNNAAHHGSHEEDVITVMYTLELGKWIKIAVSDRGTGAGKKKADQLHDLIKERQALFEKDPLSHMGIRGRGLSQIITKWVDEYQIIDNGKGGITIEILKNLENEKREV